MIIVRAISTRIIKILKIVIFLQKPLSIETCNRTISARVSWGRMARGGLDLGL